MKASATILVIAVITVFATGYALAACDCRQPAYQDQIDFVTRYTLCLDDCLNAQMEQIRLDSKTTDQRLSDLEAQIDQLNLKIRRLEAERTLDP
jgi:TolA-binding protein